MKKILALLLSIVTLITAMPCALSNSGTRAFTDSSGRTVEVPLEIERVAVSGLLAQIAVFAIAPDALVAVADKWDDKAKPFIAEKYLNLPVLGQVYGPKGEMNLESLLAADPQVVIDIGQAKATIAADMDELTAKTGIPFVHIEIELSNLDKTFAMLGELLGLESQAAQLGEYCKDVYSRVTDIANRVEKVDLVYLTDTKGFDIIARGSFHSEVIDTLSNNAAVLDSPSSRGVGNSVDFEQLLIWNPDYIMFAPGGAYDAAADDPAWRNIEAIKNGRFCEVPFGPYNWMGFPPSAHRLLGMLWMAKLLYPGEANYDLYQEASRFYELFYHCELTRGQYDDLVKKSIGV